MMSLPVMELMTQAMMDAIEFVLTRVLQAPHQLLSVWIKSRQLDQLSTSMVVVNA